MILTVVLGHLFFVIGISLKKAPAPLYQPKTLTVNTKYLPAPKVVVQHKPPTRKKTTTKQKVTKVVKPAPKRKKIIQNLEESIAKIEQKRDNSTAKNDLILPKSVDLSREAVEEERLEISYQERLVDELKSSLKLPGYGNVTVKLTLAKNGRVVGLEVVAAESDSNKDYLASSLGVMNFPPFEGSLGQYDEQTFLLTFCSD